MDLLFRKVQEEDMKNIKILLSQLWPNKSIDLAKITNTLIEMRKMENYSVFCIEENSNIIGFCVMTIFYNFWVEGKIAVINTLVVDEDKRGQGIGKKFVEKCISIARENDCKKIELESGFHREDAHRFYVNLGFDKRAFYFSKDI